MTAVLLIALIVLAAITFVQFGALTELYQQVRQLREYTEFTDLPMTLELGDRLNSRPSAVGLPAELDGVEAGIVLVLSTRCGTCRSVAKALDGTVPDRVWVVVEPVGEGSAEEFLEEFELAGERVTVDSEGALVERLGLEVSPSALLVEAGRLVRAQTIPSSRQLFKLVPKVRRLREPSPDGRPAHPVPGSRHERTGTDEG